MIFEFSGNIDTDWNQALNLWKPRGRVEDLPRSERRPQYAPDEAKIFAQKFAQEYKSEFSHLVERLRAGDKFESLCAFEVLEMICWEFYIGNVPEELLNLQEVLPSKIAQEIQNDPEVEGFSGTTIGDWFRAVFST
ncbi:hypothetical protein [Sessilibacter corallicola]|uniref:Uncharacterized protein n=1 Tax=Sessilibacter corallicola TaxID=2904075 RepID=A0ABQ0AER7_9GAMM